MTEFALETVSTPGTDQRWLTGSHGKTSQPGMLNIALITAVTASTDAFNNIVSGIGVGKITATGLYGPYNSSATDGTEVLAGYVYAPVKYKNSLGAVFATNKVTFALLKSGTIKRSILPVVAQRTAITPETVSSGQFIYAD
jgi:hypothetical protein